MLLPPPQKLFSIYEPTIQFTLSVRINELQ